MQRMGQTGKFIKAGPYQMVHTQQFLPAYIEESCTGHLMLWYS